MKITGENALMDGLLIRWSLVRVRPGEPILATQVSKTPSTFRRKPPCFQAGLRDLFHWLSHRTRPLAQWHPGSRSAYFRASHMKRLARDIA